MSTHCAIIVRDGEVFRGICCHNEGYNAGQVLTKHYNTQEQALTLVTKLSSISFLKEDISSIEEYKGKTQSSPVTAVKATDVAWNINHHNNVFVFDGLRWIYNGGPL